MARSLLNLARSAVVGLAIFCSVTLFEAPVANAQSLTPPRQYSISPTNVNLLDNTYAVTIEDLSVGPLKIERSYLGGRETSSHYFGGGWTHNFDLRISSHTGGINPTVTVFIGRTKYVVWGTLASDYPPSPQTDEYGTSLTHVGAINIFTDRDGTVYRFAPGANSDATITAPDGAVTTITYVEWKPKIVRSNRGYAVVFDYDSNGNVSAACGFNLANSVVSTSTTCVAATLKASYAYTSGKLVAATNVVGDTAHYIYGSGGLTCLTDPGTTTCKVNNAYQAGQLHITQQTMADGSVWQKICSCSFEGKDDNADSFPDDDSGASDPTGHETSFSYHGGVMTTYLDGNGQRYYTRFLGRYPTFVGLPETNAVAYGYTDRMMPTTTVFQAKSGSGLADFWTDNKVYPSCWSNVVTCNKPTSVTDANGNVTTYSYDPTHGGLLTETLPVNAAGIQAVVRHAYVQRYAWTLTSAGGYSAAGPPLWLLSEDRICRTSATVGGGCAAGSGDEAVTTYDYGPDSGPNTLLLRGKVVTAGGVSLRTCYRYDWQGNRISETTPRAGLASCS